MAESGKPTEAKADVAATQSKAKPKTKAKAKAKAHTVRKPKPKAPTRIESGQLDRIPAKQRRW